VVAAGERTLFRDLVVLLRKNRVTAVPVCDGSGRVLGVVSQSDLFLKQVEQLHDGPAPLLRRHRLEQGKATGTTAAQLMTAPAVTIRRDQFIGEAATLMHDHGVNRLPVVNSVGVLIGIVTRGDLLKAYLRADADIRRDVAERAVPEVVERPVETVDVEVHDGVVCLSGRVTRRSQVQALVALARTIDGVVAVDAQMGYDLDDTSDWAIRAGASVP